MIFLTSKMINVYLFTGCRVLYEFCLLFFTKQKWNFAKFQKHLNIKLYLVRMILNLGYGVFSGLIFRSKKYIYMYTCIYYTSSYFTSNK